MMASVRGGEEILDRFVIRGLGGKRGLMWVLVVREIFGKGGLEGGRGTFHPAVGGAGEDLCGVQVRR